MHALVTVMVEPEHDTDDAAMRRAAELMTPYLKWSEYHHAQFECLRCSGDNCVNCYGTGYIAVSFAEIGRWDHWMHKSDTGRAWGGLPGDPTTALLSARTGWLDDHMLLCEAEEWPALFNKLVERLDREGCRPVVLDYYHWDH